MARRDVKGAAVHTERKSAAVCASKALSLATGAGIGFRRHASARSFMSSKRWHCDGVPWRGARLLTCSRAMKRGGSRANIAKLPVLVRTAGLELSSTPCEGSRTTRKAADCEKFT